ESFNLKQIAIGNEQWGPLYPERLEPFVKIIRAKYPQMKIVGTAGPNPDGKDFDYGWKEMKRLGADLVDEHYYRSPEWFLKSAGRYDKYDRKGPKVFAGEYACHVDKFNNQYQEGKNDFESAL
ncbi:MAG TPA: alpha-L-arabinofuranosidase, partial [Xylanibacter oryzae]|nr:alpha-L-arabinofuranosidase [Xylanibacter oryzae]